ncbi:hypothetical protein NQ314_001606 [Rhamnusium bicolor]|uniref:Diphosphomevalonate decarboxylase n=1 Tax=Rhamnusium bicolor TaxID=1586634 RepID=A0AAV8ZRK0_9CUCU|nr:hypothetical protein NQ314_001606 [Rhamnusium bicolor]
MAKRASIMKIVTCIAPVNIAIIKYWGKSNEELIIPINDSLSGTLSTAFVQWCKGSSENGSDSIAKQIAPASHWPEMRVLILVVNDSRKKYSSTEGMKRSVETSELLKYRSQEIVPKRIELVTKAIQEKDFETFAQVTMQDSNQFHAVCLDTFPPCVYMNDTSHAIAETVHAYNDYKSSNKVAYTFDAGPNACLYILESEVQEFISVIDYIFPPCNDSVKYLRGIPLTTKPISESLKVSLNIKQHEVGSIKFIIYTKIGNGPEILNQAEDHLLNSAGVPKNL